MLTVTPNMFLGFQGLYYEFRHPDEVGYYYLIDDVIYNAEDFYLSDIPIDIFLEDTVMFPTFNIDPNGSQIIAIDINFQIGLYQKQANGQFIALLDSPEVYGEEQDGENLEVKILRVPSSDGREVPLEMFYWSTSMLHNNLDNFGVRSHDRVLNFLNNERVNARPIPRNYIQQSNIIIEEPYEILKKTYKILPDHLILNGLRVDVISFREIFDMLNQGQIERYIIDPLLQPWAQEPYKIITLFNKNGMMYLVKAQYDQTTNRILP